MGNPIVIGIAGGSGSGKTTLAQLLSARLGDDLAATIGQDNYYRDLSAQDAEPDGAVNFDCPTAIDFKLMAAHLNMLKQSQAIAMPQYCYSTHRRKPEANMVLPKRFIVMDGILVLSDESVRRLFDFTIFVDTPERERFSRRIARDIIQRGRTQECVLAQLNRFVKPMHDQHVEPTKDHADLVVSGVNPVEQNLALIVGMINEMYGPLASPAEDLTSENALGVLPTVDFFRWDPSNRDSSIRL